MLQMKTLGASFVALLGLLAISMISLLDTRANVAEAQTSTSIDYPNEVAPTLTAPNSESCKKFIDDEVDRQWQAAAFEVLRSLNKLQAFTAGDRVALREREKTRTNRQKYVLRLAILTQLAER